MSNITLDQDIAELRRKAKESSEQADALEILKAKRQRCNNRTDEALCLLENKYLPFHKLLKQHFPDLINDLGFWRAFLHIKHKLPPLPEVAFLILQKNPISILADKTIMLELCAYDSWIYHAITKGNPLKNDWQIVEAVLLSNPSFVSEIPVDILEQHTNLVGITLARLPLSVDYLSKKILTTFTLRLWREREIILGWAKGGGVFHDAIPTAFLNEKAIFLAFQDNEQKQPSQLQIPTHLKRNKQFMMAAVEKHPKNIEQIADQLLRDYDIPIAALSTPKGVAIDKLDDAFLQRWLQDDYQPYSRDRNHHIFLFQIAATIQKQLQSHHTFVTLILGSTYGNTKPFSILNQDNTTVHEAYMEPIASFAGVPTGKKLRKLRNASKTLALLGVH